MNFSWSTPLRRNGQTDLPLIPNEIYLHIFECIASIDEPLCFDQDVKIFSALALVCRFFRSVALPRIFECVTFSANIHTNNTLASRGTKWARQILANTEPAMSLALYVKECTFKHLAFCEEAKWLFPFASLHCQAMTRMSNIQNVVFSSSFVKTDHWQALAELKQLDGLQFHSCSFIDDPPDKELPVRSVWLSYSSTTFTLRPIATTSLRSLTAGDVEVVLKIVAFRQLAIDILYLDQRISNIEPLLQVFRHLPSLHSVTFNIEGQALASSYSKLSLKKLFTHLHSFTIDVFDGEVPRHDNDDIGMLVSGLCDGPGTLPSLKALNIYLDPRRHRTTNSHHMIIYNCINQTIVPAFPNVRRINTNAGYLRLEKGNWKVDSLYNS